MPLQTETKGYIIRSKRNILKLKPLTYRETHHNTLHCIALNTDLTIVFNKNSFILCLVTTLHDRDAVTVILFLFLSLRSSDSCWKPVEGSTCLITVRVRR